ncbi:MAG: hypothetical protein NVS3B7_04270 [Candidatus Elarobacter sp.]
MISRSTLIGALVVVELGIVGMAAKAIAGDAAGMGFGFPAASPSFAAPFTRTYQATFPSGARPHVVIDVHDLDVVVQSNAAATMRVVEVLQKSGYVRGTFAHVSAEQTSDGLRIASSGADGEHMVIGSLTHQLTLVVPPGARVEVLSGGRIEAGGLRAKFIAHVEDGAIHLTNHRGDVDVSTASGRIYLTDVQGTDIAASTHEGRLYLTRIGAERIDAHTNFGNVFATDVRAVDGALTTKSGRIALSLAGNSDVTVTAQAGDGETVSVSGIASTGDDDQKRIVRLGSGRGHFEVSTPDDSIAITQGANV